MKPGDRVRISNCKDDSYYHATLISITEESATYKHDTVGGAFTCSRKYVSPASFCSSCECDPCDCDWGQ